MLLVQIVKVKSVILSTTKSTYEKQFALVSGKAAKKASPTDVHLFNFIYISDKRSATHYSHGTVRIIWEITHSILLTRDR